MNGFGGSSRTYTENDKKIESKDTWRRLWIDFWKPHIVKNSASHSDTHQRAATNEEALIKSSRGTEPVT